MENVELIDSSNRLAPFSLTAFGSFPRRGRSTIRRPEAAGRITSPPHPLRGSSPGMHVTFISFSTRTTVQPLRPFGAARTSGRLCGEPSCLLISSFVPCTFCQSALYVPCTIVQPPTAARSPPNFGGPDLSTHPDISPRLSTFPIINPRCISSATFPNSQIRNPKSVSPLRPFPIHTRAAKAAHLPAPRAPHPAPRSKSFLPESFPM